MKRTGGLKSDGRGLHVTKMPENDNKANLTDLTIRTSAFMNSERKEMSREIVDEESGGYAA